jgi:ketosteroid isomerase-like protein
MNEQEARQFGGEWVRAWNAHDLEQILTHYAQEVQFTSPFIVKLLGQPSGTIVGKDDLRVYFEKGPESRGVICSAVFCRGARGRGW